MDKLKSALSSNKEGESDATGATGRVTGQGSHFRQAQDSAGYSLGGAQSAYTMDSAKQGETAAVQDTSASSGLAGAGAQTATAGSAAVGSTSTYSSHHLGTGDPNPSVVDRSSNDPTTYQTPEKNLDTGVPAGSATMAATAAFAGGKEGESMPGAYPSSGAENPYRTDNLDPRVDDLASRPKDNSAAGGMGMATAAAGVATAEAADRSHEATGPAPSALTDTTNPADRSAVLGQAEQEKGIEQPQPSMVGKVLGAVGLGSLAGGAVASQAGKGEESAVADTPEQPTTVTGTTAYTAPTESKPPAHYRKESIPTTAYPGGIDSPAPTAPPVGGTQQEEERSHTGRDAAIGGVAGGAAAGTAAAAISHEQKPTQVPAESGTGTGGLAYDSVTSRQPETVQPTGQAEPVDHSKRDATLAGVAGAGAAGAGAYGISEHEKRKAEDTTATQAVGATPSSTERTVPTADTAERRRDEDEPLRKAPMAAEAAPAGAYAVGEGDRQRAAEEAAKPNKLQKSEDQAAKRAEKEEKKQHKEAAVGAGAGAGAGAAAYEAGKDEKLGEEKEKKPSIFKRLFKRTRKNKDTGEDEEYESEHEDDNHKGTAAAAGVAGGAGAAALAHDKDATPTKYEESSGGLQKPSYNPFSKDDPKLADVAESGRTGEPIPHSTATDKTAENVDPVTGLAVDPSKDPEAARRVSEHVHGEGMGDSQGALRRADRERAVEAADGSMPHEPLTGLPYDPSKDPAAAARIEQTEHGVGMTGSTKDAKREERAIEEREGETHKESMGEKIKHKLGLD